MIYNNKVHLYIKEWLTNLHPDSLSKVVAWTQDAKINVQYVVSNCEVELCTEYEQNKSSIKFAWCCMAFLLQILLISDISVNLQLHGCLNDITLNSNILNTFKYDMVISK